MSDSDASGFFPPFSVRELCIVDESVDLMFMCNGKRFFVTVDAADLDDREQTLKNEYLDILNGDDPPTEIENWTTDALYAEFVRLAPFESRKDPMSLQDYYRPEAVYLYKLVNKHGKARPVPLPSDSDPNAYRSPKELISNIPDREEFLLVDAAKVQILPMPGSEDFVASDTPRQVLFEGKKYYFKEVQDPDSFHREFGILRRIHKLGLTKTHRLPTLCAAVHYSDEPEYMLGFLMELIDSKGSLGFPELSEDSPREVREKWMAQVEETVQQLHSNGIFWGDVKPNNVLIDEDGNAWVIDFGGGYNSRFVDEELVGTADGDLQGLSRLREFLGL